MLDARYDALGFFSDGGFRYFLPAYLIAGFEGRLWTADPKRYGATSGTTSPAIGSLFAKEEPRAIVAYLEQRRDPDPHKIQKTKMDAALDYFWRERAAHAPDQLALRDHPEAEEQYVREIQGKG